MRVVGMLSGAIGLGAAAVVVALTAAGTTTPAGPGESAVPQQLAGYSHLTGSVSASAPGRALALFQHGFGVELLDFPQAVVLGADGDSYRRVDAAEDRAGASSQGDPAPMLLSPDGTRVAVGVHSTEDPDVIVVDLLTGATTIHPLPTGRSVIPVAWSTDGETLAHLLSAEPTNPYSGERITGDIGLLDLTDDTTTVLPDGGATAAAFSPDDSELAVEQIGSTGQTLSIVDLETGEERGLGVDGVLAGPAAWSPDGRLLATTTVRPAGAPAGVSDPGIPTGLSFVDPSGQDGDVPAAQELPLSGPGRVLGWTDSDEVVMLLGTTGDDDVLSSVPLDGGEPRELTRLAELQNYGIGRLQVASATVGDLQVVTPTDIDRGNWPLPLRGGLALLAGLVAWLVARFVVRRTTRAAAADRVTDPRR